MPHVSLVQTAPQADGPASPGLSVIQKRLMGRIFQHPMSHNLSWREVLELFHGIGSVEHAHNGDVVLHLGADHQSFLPPHDKDLGTEDIMALRHFLTRAGWTHGAAPVRTKDQTSSDLVIVIDHAEARIFPAGSADAAAPKELHHLKHYIDRSQNDADRAETFPADTRYFDAIAAAVGTQGRIVVVGHGHGQSNEADHLMAYLSQHHGAVHSRVAREIVADLPHTSVSELLQLARHALQTPTDQVAAH